MLEHDTLMAYLDQWAAEKPDEIWLRDLKGEGSDDYTWSESRRQIHSVATAPKHATPQTLKSFSCRITVRTGFSLIFRSWPRVM